MKDLTLKNNIYKYMKEQELEVKDILPLCKWSYRSTFFKKVERYDRFWSLEEITTLLNKFQATFEDVFLGEETGHKHRQSAPKKNLKRSFSYYVNERGILMKEVYKAMECSRQNYARTVRAGRFKLCHIINLLDVLKVSFADLFLERVSFNIEDHILLDNDKEVI